jgi:hypothetical protein
MAFIPFPSGVVGARIQFNIDGIPGEMTEGFRKFTGAATYTDGLAIAGIIDTWITGDLLTSMTPNITFTQTIIDDLTSASGWQASVVNGGAGTHSGDPVQSQVCMVMTINTAKRGRSYRGRTYIPCIPALELYDSKSWSPSPISAWESIFDDLNNAVNTAGWTWCILSRIQDKMPLGTGIATPITGFRGNAKLGTQRRRLS